MHSQLSRPLQTPPLSCSFKGFSSSYSFVFILLCPIHLLERHILSVINMNFAFYHHNSSQDSPISLLFLPQPLSVHSFILQNSTTPPTFCLPLYLIPLYSIPLSFPCYIPITLKKSLPITLKVPSAYISKFHYSLPLASLRDLKSII